MSDKNKKSSELVVLQRIPSYQGLVKSNRWRLRSVFFLMTIVFISGFFLRSPTLSLATNQSTPSRVYASEAHPALSAEVNELKGQLVGLVSGSIESKLGTLENSIRSGATAASLGAIADLKNDVKTLRLYTAPVKKQPAVVANEQLIQEMSHLKRLIYLSFASCALMFAALASIWIKNTAKLPFKQAILRYLTKH
jgi:hypothetical protein